jgi:hypothetical protein
MLSDKSQRKTKQDKAAKSDKMQRRNVFPAARRERVSKDETGETQKNKNDQTKTKSRQKRKTDGMTEQATTSQKARLRTGRHGSIQG